MEIKIGQDWIKLAASLDQHIDIDDIINQSNSSFAQSRRFLEVWYQKNYPNTKVSKLKDALMKIDRKDIVHNINQYDESEGYKALASSSFGMSIICILHSRIDLFIYY